MSCKKNQEKRRKWDLSRVRENGWGSNVRCCGRMGYYMCLWNRGYTLPGLWCFDKEWQLLKGDLRAELNFNNHIGSKQRSDTSFFFFTLSNYSDFIFLSDFSCMWELLYSGSYSRSFHAIHTWFTSFLWLSKVVEDQAVEEHFPSGRCW